MQDDHLLAAELARQAGELLLDLRAELGFTDQRALRDAGDKRSHEFLMARLAEARPGDAVLSEEGADDAARLSAERVWIVDPLDGTREFGEDGRTDWAVHVALWTAAGRPPAGATDPDGDLAAGAVALPAQGEVLGTGTPAAMPPGDGDTLRLAVSRTRPPEFFTRLLPALESAGSHPRTVPMGSAGAKISAVLTGEVDAYVHAGGQYQWDSAAPVAVARAAGAHCSRIDGSELRYNGADRYLPDILVCRPEMAGTLLDAIRVAQAVPPAAT